MKIIHTFTNTLKIYCLTILLSASLLCLFSTNPALAQNTSANDTVRLYNVHDYIIVTVDPDNWYLTLINKNYRVALDYKPPKVEVLNGTGVKSDSRVAPHFNKMYDAAKADGVTLIARSSYQPITSRIRLFSERVQKRMEEEGLTEYEAVYKTAQSLGYPGGSEHNLGFAVDFSITEDIKQPVSGSFMRTDQYKWLVVHAADYGFILRLPPDKLEITGVIHEPWHWRYVGVEVAKEIMARGITLEEYLGRPYLSPEEAQKLKEQGVSIEEYLQKQ